MRRILITDDLKKEVKDFNSNLFSSHNKTFLYPLKGLKKLSQKIRPRAEKEFKNYVELIIDQYDEILNADPNKMLQLIAEFDKVCHHSKLSLKLRNFKKSFHEEVVYALRYSDYRDEEYRRWLLYSNLKTCTYCNSKHTVTFEKKYYNSKTKKGEKELVSKCQLDHFYPQSKYPFLATSFFNLFPTCANCNLKKGKKDVNFCLYTSDRNQIEFSNFWLDDTGVVEYLKSFNRENLKIYFEVIDGDWKSKHVYDDIFDIQHVYDEFKDIAEEILIKAKANPQSYRDILANEFNNLFNDPTIIDRILVGNYTNPEEVFKRPFAKYSQDIARQLKLIP